MDPAAPSRSAPPETAARLRGVASSPVRDILALTERPGVISFAGGLPEPALFDVDGLRAAFERALSGDAARRSLQYSTTEGDPRLRECVAELMAARGVPTSPDDLLITTGSQQALTLVATLLVEPGTVVLVEEPAYLAALQAFRLAGARLVPVDCDEDGLVPEALEAAVLRERPALLYTVPTFQNPTGRTLPAARRDAVARIAAEHGLWVLEDDPYGELRYDGEPAPALASHPEIADRVLALSTLSKVAAPGLRIGWVRAPALVRRSLVIAKQAADLHTSTVDQAACAVWLGETDLPAHVGHLREVYRERRDALLAGLPQALPPGSTWNRPGGGMFVWGRLPDGHDAAELLRAAIERDVAFVPGAPFFGGEPDPATLRLSFTTHPPAEIAEGLARLRTAWA
ncbi:MAG: PLP-dependent aminotransferase family protein [Solirubrobacteraceae bacterium]|nr:PLP-dependent aminotransferase family protein [Solirubrobacteraceae bacterium]